MRAILAALLLLLVIAGSWLGFTLYRAQQQAGDPFGVAFNLVDGDGEQITEQALRGHPSVVFFGFTHCPEVCPTTLYELDGWLKELGEEGEDIEAYFVTIDPERDTPEVIGDYVANVSDRITAISGDPEKVEEMARGFHVYFKRVDTDDGGYTMDHTASVFLLDSQGRFRKTIAYGESSDTAIQKLRDLAST